MPESDELDRLKKEMDQARLDMILANLVLDDQAGQKKFWKFDKNEELVQVWLSACNEAYDLAMELLEGNGQATRSAQANDEVIEQQPTIMAASPFASEPVDAPEEIINPPSPTKSDNGAQIDQPTAANMTPVGTPARAPDTIAMSSEEHIPSWAAALINSHERVIKNQERILSNQEHQVCGIERLISDNKQILSNQERQISSSERQEEHLFGIWQALTRLADASEHRTNA